MTTGACRRFAASRDEARESALSRTSTGQPLELRQTQRFLNSDYSSQLQTSIESMTLR
jgi:hypothetical protein